MDGAVLERDDGARPLDCEGLAPVGMPMTEPWNRKPGGWNYRIFREQQGEEITYELREAYYDGAGKVVASAGPVRLDGYESVKELVESLTLMLGDSTPCLLKRNAHHILTDEIFGGADD